VACRSALSEREILAWKTEVAKHAEDEKTATQALSASATQLSQTDVQRLLDLLQKSAPSDTTSAAAVAESKKSGADGFTERVTDAEMGVESVSMMTPITGVGDLALVPLETAVEPLGDAVPKLGTHVFAAQTYAEECAAGKSHGLTAEHVAAIHLYTQEWTVAEQSLYAQMNANLRNSDRTKIKPYFSYLRLLTDALGKLPPSDAKLLFRGVRKNVSAQYKKGKKVFWWAFNSCSTDAKLMQNAQFLGTAGARTMFQIEHFSGVEISAFSSVQKEAEVLLRPGTHLEVQSDPVDLGSGLWMIHLKEIKPKCAVFS
jgi:hypothetical protein